MTTSIILLLLLSTVQVSCVFNCYKCTTIGITDVPTQTAVAQFLSNYVNLLTTEQACSSSPVTQGGGCNLACVHLKLTIDFSQYSGPQIGAYASTQIRSLGKIPVSIRDCLEAQWPSLLRFITWGSLPPINAASTGQSCFNMTGGIYGTPVVGRICLANTGDYRAQDPVITDLTSSPAQPTATQPTLPISFDNCAEAYMPNPNLGTILTVAGYKMPTLVNVSAIDPVLRTPAQLTQLQSTNNLNIATCFFPNQVMTQGCTQAAYSAGIGVDLRAYSGGDISISPQLLISQAGIRAFNSTSAVARGCITELPAKGFGVPTNIPYQSIPEGDNCFNIRSNIWNSQFTSQICMCNKNGCNVHAFTPVLSSAMSKRIALSLIAAPFLVSMSLIAW